MAKENKAPVSPSIVIDDGTREFPIYNKFGKLICKVYFRPADISIIDRYNAMMLDFDSLVEPLKNLSLNNDGTVVFERDWQTLKQVENNLKDRLNALFDMDGADDIFAHRNPFSSVGGRFFCLNVLDALKDVVAEAVEEEAQLSQQRMSEYLSDLEENPATEETANADDGVTTDAS